MAWKTEEIQAASGAAEFSPALGLESKSSVTPGRVSLPLSYALKSLSFESGFHLVLWGTYNYQRN